MSELLPCPFCGGPADIDPDPYRIMKYVCCRRCGFALYNYQQSKANEAWNTRAAQQSKGEKQP